MDIVIQGPLFKNTIETAKTFLRCNFVDKVIVSIWQEKVEEDLPEGIEIINNTVPIDYGTVLNLKIYSTRKGLEKTTNDIVGVFRSDQVFYKSSIEKYHTFFEENKNKNNIDYLDGTKRKHPIFVLAMGSQWPYHPQDHVFWGCREDIIKHFNMPYMTEKFYIKNPQKRKFDIELREPIYIGAHYYKYFSDKVEHHLENFKDYLVDGAPNFLEALIEYNKIRDKVFVTFPEVDIWWEKYNKKYPYEWYGSLGEYTHEDL